MDHPLAGLADRVTPGLQPALDRNQLAVPDRYDVLVVGCGAAGLYSALCLPDHLRVAVLTKATLSRSASDWAQGGLAAAVATDDSPQFHLQDTLAAGAGLCDRAAVEFLVENAPACVESLVAMGVGFDRRSSGELATTLEAAHSHHRVLHAADATGRAVVSALVARVLERSNIDVIQGAIALDLWLADGLTGPTCRGIIAVIQGRVIRVAAKATILATGGGGRVFAQTTNPPVSTGDGLAIAYRAGAVLRDLEFFQFHPTALNIPGAPHFLISEAVRGEGAHLIDATGRRFAFDYHPAGELAPRDTVSRAIFQHLQRHGGDRVWLDLRPIPTDRSLKRFPNILKTCREWGLDPLTEPIPVSPAAHYWMGGIATDRQNQTSIAGLYAVGEVASTGVHGANRLASNSLLECIVYGAQFRHLTLTPEPDHPEPDQPELDHPEPDQPELEPAIAKPDPALAPNLTGPSSQSQDLAATLAKAEPILTEIHRDLPHLVWQAAGICREEKTLTVAIDRVGHWQSLLTAWAIDQKLLNTEYLAAQASPLDEATIGRLALWSETRNLLNIGELILLCARTRQESRGGHYRSDYPEPNPAWAVHLLVERGPAGPHWRRSTIGLDGSDRPPWT